MHFATLAEVVPVGLGGVYLVGAFVLGLCLEVVGWITSMTAVFMLGQSFVLFLYLVGKGVFVVVTINRLLDLLHMLYYIFCDLRYPFLDLFSPPAPLQLPHKVNIQIRYRTLQLFVYILYLFRIRIVENLFINRWIILTGTLLVLQNRC